MDLKTRKKIDSLCQKTPIIIPKKRTFKPEDAIENTAFKPGLKVVKF